MSVILQKAAAETDGFSARIMAEQIPDDLSLLEGIDLSFAEAAIAGSVVG
jgi:hypothetical protein